MRLQRHTTFEKYSTLSNFMPGNYNFRYTNMKSGSNDEVLQCHVLTSRPNVRMNDTSHCVPDFMS